MKFFGGLFGTGSGSFGSGLFGGSVIGGGNGRSPSFESIVSQKPKTPYIPESVKERCRNSDNQVLRDIQSIADDIEDLHETMVDGSVEILIKGNTDYKTSFEKREEADRMVSKEKARYKAVCDKVNEEIKNLNNHIAVNRARKEKILSSLAPYAYNGGSVGYVSGNTYSPSMHIDGLMEAMFNTSFGKSSMQARKEAADNYLEDARDYQVQVSSKIAELHRAEAKIYTVEAILQEEDELLNALENADSIKRSENSRKLYSYLKTLLEEYIVDQTGNPNGIYTQTLKELKQLCSYF